MKTALFIALGIFAASYMLIWFPAIARKWRTANHTPDLRDNLIGMVTNFFDTLGIGSYATTSSFFKLWGLVRDEQIPGTMNVGHTIPTIIQAMIYMAVVQVDVITLVSMISASAVGAWLGAGVVSSWSRRKVQIGMGAALMVVAALLIAKVMNWMPGGGAALGLTGAKLAIAVVVNMFLGALMTLGIGLYAPCMVLISLLGMDPHAAYPIMMGSCAFLMPVGSARFIREGSYNLKSALGLAIGGIPGVLIAAFIVKEMPLKWLLRLVIVVVVYTAITLLRSAMVERASATAIPVAASGD